MDGPTTSRIDASRQFEWPPADSAGIPDLEMHETEPAPPLASGGTTPTAGSAAMAGQMPAAAERQRTVPEQRTPAHPRTVTGRWRRAGVRGAAIGAIGAFAFLDSGSSTPRAQKATFDALPAAARSQLLVPLVAEPPTASSRSGGSLTVPGPAGARVSIDGEPRGIAPVSIAGLPPGTHEVRVTTSSNVAAERVTVAEGSATTLVVSTPAQRSQARAQSPVATPPARAPAPGMVAVSLPFEVQIFEDGRFAGTSSADLVLAPGPHRLELVNKSLNYRAVESVQVASNTALKIPAAPPMGTLSLNALPWAEVFIDGRKLGETPLGQVRVPIGAHELVFRHPQLGEQSRSVTVTADGPTRVSVDLRK